MSEITIDENWRKFNAAPFPRISRSFKFFARLDLGLVEDGNSIKRHSGRSWDIVIKIACCWWKKKIICLSQNDWWKFSISLTNKYYHNPHKILLTTYLLKLQVVDSLKNILFSVGDKVSCSRMQIALLLSTVKLVMDLSCL